MKTIFNAVLAYLSRLGRDFGAGWNQFWFAPSAPHTLGVIRICTGLILVYIHLTTFHRLLDIVGPNAFIDQQAIRELSEFPEKVRRTFLESRQQGMPVDPEFNLDDLVQANTWYRFSIYEWVTDPVAIQCLHAGFVLAMILFTVGLGTRVTAVLAWLGHLSYINRGYTVWFGMDSMLLFISFYLMFSPCGWAYSLDRLIARWRAIRRAGGGHEPLGEPAPAPLHWSTTTFTRMIQVHMGIVYFCAGVSKLQGGTWWSGYATWMTMNTSEFALVDMRWLGTMPLWVWNSITTATSYATLAFEIGFVFLIWYPFWRPILLTFAVLLHAGIGFFMGLVAFGNIMLTGCMSFIPPEKMEWFVTALLKGGRTFQFRYSRGDETSLRQAALLKTVDCWNQISFVDAGNVSGGGELEAPTGVKRGKSILVAALGSLRASWLVAPLLLAVFPSGGESKPAPESRQRGNGQAVKQ